MIMLILNNENREAILAAMANSAGKVELLESDDLTTSIRQLHSRQYFINLGKFLAKKRKERDITQAQLAKQLGYSSPQYISNFERGISVPSYILLQKIAPLLDLAREELIHFLLEEHKKYLYQML